MSRGMTGHLKEISPNVHQSSSLSSSIISVFVDHSNRTSRLFLLILLLRSAPSQQEFPLLQNYGLNIWRFLCCICTMGPFSCFYGLGFRPVTRWPVLKCQYINKLYYIVCLFFSNVYVMGGTAMHVHIFIFIMKLCWCIRSLSKGLPLINSLCCALALSEANRRRWMVLMSGFSCLETQLTLKGQGQADPSPSSVSLFDLQPFLLLHSARSAFNTRAEVSAGHCCRNPPPPPTFSLSFSHPLHICSHY